MSELAVSAPPSASSPEERARTLLRAIHSIADAGECDRFLDTLLAHPQPVVVGFVNAHAINLVWRDAGILDAFLKANVLLRDGSGTAMWMRALGLPEGLNLNGTDLIPRILARAGKRPLAILGTRDPYLFDVVGRLKAEGHAVVASRDGFQPEADYGRLCAETQPQVVVLAMGMPKQERVAEHVRAAASGPCLILCGGAIIDFMAGRFARAPIWMRRLGIEWIYRLVQEPRRLLGRYVVGVPVSLYRLRRVKRHFSRD